VTQNTPPFGIDIVHPKIVQALLSVPSAEKVDKPLLVIDAHRVSATFAWRIPVGVDAMQTHPNGLRLTCAEICVKEAIEGEILEGLLCDFPVTLENQVTVEIGDERMFKLEAGTGSDGVIWCKKATTAEVFEDVTECGRFAILTCSVGLGEYGY
jgi:hypothetical protein